MGLELDKDLELFFLKIFKTITHPLPKNFLFCTFPCYTVYCLQFYVHLRPESPLDKR